ncbi:MAG: ArsR/SmtB family transcription factor [Candidatus Baltobacteraceae bacterium]
MSIQRCCPPATMVEGDFTQEAELFKALGDPHRLAILATLARSKDDVCVCDFTAGLPLGQPAVSHHLKILREAGLVQCQRRGTWVYYTLAPRFRARIVDVIHTIVPKKVAA